jgi:3-deoxy-D-manno-octulosonate 8-phosphate phosphatase KdsC-like HAD superfamily phosphatase
LFRGIADKGGTDKLLRLAKKLAIERERRSASEKDRARWLRIQAVYQGGGGLGFEAVCLAEI